MLWRNVWKTLKKSRIGLVGLGLILLFVLISILGPLIALHDPLKINLAYSLEGPSRDAWLGTDVLGRDILSRLLCGARPSLLICFGAVGFGMIIGVPLGVCGGYFRGKVDLVIRSLADLLLAFPPFLLALSLIAAIGVGLNNVLLAVGISTVPVYIRLVRAETFTIAEEDYVTSSVALGRSNTGIIIAHILPNIIPVIVVQSTLFMGITLLYAAGLGFLGLGAQQPQPEWGAMLGAGRNYIFSAPQLSLFPGLAIFVTILGFNLLGDALRDALDPYQT